MTKISYPAQYSVVAEEEMTYITGGADLKTIGILAGVAIVGLAALGMAISSTNEALLQKRYEKKFGVSAIDPETHTYTEDFDLYRQRSVLQDWSTGSKVSASVTPVLIKPLATVLGIGLVGVMFYVANFAGSDS